MLPTLKVGQVVEIRPISSDNHVGRADIVVFKLPAGSDPGIDDLVKRVVGLPGETISAHGGHIYIDGKQLSEPYLTGSTVTTDFFAVTLSPDRYWLMGDNRGNSKDSRVFGPIPRRDIVGTVSPRQAAMP
jgi:signal peptidase I